ncbi:40S ribosomal protein S27 [Pestalotiopsis sp. IQ-011]
MPPSPVAAGSSNPNPASPEAPPKRRRLNFACNYCRNRKSRCDEQKPSCRACLTAGIPCVTVDKRRPGVSITRHEAGATPSGNNSSQGTTASCRTNRAIPGSYTGTTAQKTHSVVPLTSRSANEQQEDGNVGRPWKPPRRVPNGGTDFVADMDAETDHVTQAPKFSGPLPMMRPSSGNCTSELLTDWLDLAFHRLGIRKRLGPLLAPAESHLHFQQPMLIQEPPPFPDPATCQELLFLYLEEVNAVFPVLDAAKTGQMLDAALQLGPAQFAHEHGFLSLLLIYVVVGPRLGLSRPGPPPRRGQPHHPVNMTKHHHEVDRLRTWRCIYCFERILAFELGRPPLIPDESCQELDPGRWSFSTNGRSHPRPSFLHILGTFADIVGEISRLATRSRDTEETAGSSGIDGAIRDKVKTIGESCSKMLKWADELPDEYKPRSDFIYDPGSFPFTSFIALQYSQALLMLIRNSLLVSNKAIQLAIDTVAPGTPWERVIRNGPTLAIDSARRTVQLLIEAADSDMKPLLPSISVPLHALYILSVKIIRNPKSRMAKSDLNLIHDAADFTKQHHELSTADRKLHIFLDKLGLLLNKIMSSTLANTPRIIAAQRAGAATTTQAGTTIPHPQHHAVPDDADPQRQAQPVSFEPPPSYEHMDMGSMDFGAAFGESPAISLESMDAGFSPEVTHDIGWGWVDFTQLFPETL